MNATTINLTAADYDELTRYARRRTRCEADAMDCVQDAVVATLTATIDASKGALVAYAMRVLAHKVTDFYRHANRFSVSVEAAAIDVEAPTYDHEAADRAAAALDAVSAEIARRESSSKPAIRENARILRAVLVEGRDAAEVAADFGVSVNAVYSAKAGAVASVREKLARAYA